MVRLTAILILILAIAAPLVGAASAAYLQRDEETGEIDLLDQEEPKQKAPETIDEYANRFYKNCKETESERLEEDIAELYCGCRAANLVMKMSMKEVRAMQKDTDEGRFQRKRMMMFVDGLCVPNVARPLILQQCFGGAKVTGNMRNAGGTCGCLANRLEYYLAQAAPGILDQGQRLRHDVSDPLGYVLNSSAYDLKLREYTLVCVAQFENRGR